MVIPLHQNLKTMSIKTSFALVILSLAISSTSCKKKDTSSPIDNTSNNSSNTTTSTNYGVFVSCKQSILTNTLVSNMGSYTAAYISNSVLINNNPSVGSLVSMGNVTLNGIQLQQNGWNVSNMYRDTTETVHNTPLNWNITGTSSVQSFSFSNTNAYPTYTGQAAILDSFIVANNISIPLTNYSGADEVETYFVTSTNPVANTSLQFITGSPSSLNFTSTDLAIIGQNPNVTLVITFHKNNYQTINGKLYNFRTSTSLLKSNIKFK